MQLRPGIEGARVWNTLHNKRTSEEAWSAWYTVVHNILSTHAMLYTIRLVDTEVYPLCGKQDTTTASTYGVRSRPGNLGMDSHSAGVDTLTDR
jgi:hypothetical protein